MVELRERARLAQETLGEARLVGCVAGEDLERDVAIELLVACAIDRAHAALAEQRADLELREARGELLWARRRRAARGRRLRVVRRGLGGDRDLEQAPRAARAPGRDRRSALRAAFRGHGDPRRRERAPVLRGIRREVREP